MGWLLSGGCSIQDALRAFLLPIKNDDARLDFYTVYKKEAMDYDTDYVKKYDDDLNTTLIFVRRQTLPSALSTHPICSRRQVCSLPSVQPLSSMSNQSSNPIRMNSLLPSSVQSSSPSINPLSQARTPPFLPLTKAPPAGLPPHRASCTQVCWCHCWPHLSRCWGSSGSTVTCGTQGGRRSNVAEIVSGNWRDWRDGHSTHLLSVYR